MAEPSKGASTRASGSGRAGGKRAAGKADPDNKTVTIKKYANRRLYNTATSSYVTLDHLCQMVKDGVEFVVYDAKTGEDITRAVLTQIIVEEEAKGQNLLPIGFLRQLISFYGDNLQMVVPGYLESSMATFAENQERMRSYMKEAFGGMYPFGSFEDMTKRNLAMMEQAMRMFQPTPDKNGEDKPHAAGDDRSADTATAVRDLQTQLETLQRQLVELSSGTISSRQKD